MSSGKERYFESWKFDRRVVERYLQRGLITEKEYQAFLKQLPNLEGEYEEVSVDDLLPESLVKKLIGEESKESEEGEKGEEK